MTGDEWMQLVDWVTARYPNNGWHPEQAVAYYSDLAEFEATDVWAAVMGLYEQGREFPPNGSQILARAREERRRQARNNQYLSLPEPPAEWMTFKEWVTAKTGKAMSAQEWIEHVWQRTRTGEE